ncbi:hypothetical protein [Chelatococcus sp.]|uniref:hypothetical protein n=1 Tax=Chelatococcus sp. TaxID=1953771 RepID=UPI001EBE1122|nr:hypothetical protein [Chelatococcus sp.]MBX3547307.1 hypothetical protein [Chelatococcus sp.]CAH1677855.1 conserved hypothetical protein [Hyphomicrobiales bacterium]
MALKNYFVMTAAQRTTLMAMNTPDAAINPRSIDNGSPGVGINLNPDAEDFEPGAVVDLGGNYVTAKRAVDDPDYNLYVPSMVAYLLTLPWATLEDETIFAPASEND